nr:hypothetical protein [Bradyrhizobium sp. 15]
MAGRQVRLLVVARRFRCDTVRAVDVFPPSASKEADPGDAGGLLFLAGAPGDQRFPTKSYLPPVFTPLEASDCYLRPQKCCIKSPGQSVA